MGVLEEERETEGVFVLDSERDTEGLGVGDMEDVLVSEMVPVPVGERLTDRLGVKVEEMLREGVKVAEAVCVLDCDTLETFLEAEGVRVAEGERETDLVPDPVLVCVAVGVALGGATKTLTIVVH